MNKQITILEDLLSTKKRENTSTKYNKTLLLFELDNGLVIPPDLAEYFRLLNDAKNNLDRDMYQFCPFDRFKSIYKELAHWGGVPDYRNIVNTLPEYENCFVFAEYMVQMFTYAIRLYKDARELNEVYIICGDKYKIVANSFSGFLELYFEDSIELQFT